MARRLRSSSRPTGSVASRGLCRATTEQGVRAVRSGVHALELLVSLVEGPGSLGIGKLPGQAALSRPGRGTSLRLIVRGSHVGMG
jgi:hypothetical protein